MREIRAVYGFCQDSRGGKRTVQTDFGYTYLLHRVAERMCIVREGRQREVDTEEVCGLQIRSEGLRDVRNGLPMFCDF